MFGLISHSLSLRSTRGASRRLFSMALSFSFCLLAACQTTVTEPNPPTPSTSPSGQSSASPAPNTEGQPPAIPTFPSQGAIPEGREGGVRGGGDFTDGASAEAPMAAPAAGSAADSASAGSSADRASSGEAKTSRPAPFPPSLPIDLQNPPKAGLLTAGEWNDNTHWDFWLNLGQNQEWSRSMGLWGMNTQQRIEVKLTGPNGPLADTPVILRDAQSQKMIFQARTNNQGVAYVFKNWMSQTVASFDTQQNTQQTDANSNDLEIVVNQGQESLSHALTDSETTVSLRSALAQEPAVNADLMLVVDTTGSMGDELEYLKQELKNVAGRIGELSRQDLTLRLSTNFYRDTTDEYVVRPFPFSTDSDTVATQLSAQSAGGGGDFPEAVDYALVDAIDEHQWSETAKARLLFLVLDAPAHQSSEVLNRLRTSVERAAAKGIRIIPVASSGIDKDTEFLLRALSITTGGRYVFLTDDSGIGGGHIEPTVGDFTVEKLNDLMVRVATEYITDANIDTTFEQQPTPVENQN